MKSYSIRIDIDAVNDIKENVDWYNSRNKDLGLRFKKNVKQQINSLKNTAELYSVRHKTIHCMLVKKFPFLIHFAIDKANHIVKVLAVIHTSRTPEIWDEKTKNI